MTGAVMAPAAAGESSLRQRLVPGSSSSLVKEQPESGQGDSSEAAAAAAAPTEDSSTQQQSKKSAYGRTPDGTVFKIPHTHDVLTGLFDPRLPKSSLDLVTLATLGSQVLLWLYLPDDISKWLFMVLFAFWRLAYNAGLGWLLTQQSKRRFIVNTFKRNGWLDENKHPKIKSWITRQVSIKMGDDYEFDSMPIEWNTWVIFRHSVDIILLNDFLSYFFCGISFMTFPDRSDSKAVFLCILRWVSGITLLVFNLWVKTDAHRIITDLAWYWADTFFATMQDLVFDGVFEMAPHPMYSVGYAGYYGLSLIAGSEAVLYISLAAHACQFAFLVFFEEPHIERTYGERKPLAMRTPMATRKGPPRPLDESALVTEETATPTNARAGPSEGTAPRNITPRPRKMSTASDASSSQDTLDADTPAGTEGSNYDTDTDSAAHAFSRSGDNAMERRRASSTSSMLSADLDAEDDVTAAVSSLSSDETISMQKPYLRSKHDFDAWYFRHDTLIFQNFDPLRATDFAFGLAAFYSCAAFLLPYLSEKQQLVAVFVNALLWRVGHTFGLGSILKAQSERKWLVRHYLKHYYYEGTGFSAVEEAFSNWKSIYNMSLCMVYASFGMVAFKYYDWTLTDEKVRHVLGMLLIALHIWTSKGIYEALGRFGWFYGDFFIASEGAPPQLFYTGIYRHVNNPERIMGGAAFFGLAVMSGSKAVAVLAVISVLSHFWFLSRVENPHMQRLYGDKIRQEAGVTKTFKGVASKNAHRAPPQVAKAVQEFQGTLERVYDDTSLAVEEFLKRSAPRLSGYVENTKVLLRESGERLLITRVADVASLDRNAYSVKVVQPDRDEHDASLPDLPRASGPTSFQVGEAIKVQWSAPANCSRRDWIGLYRLGANKSKLVTRIRSKGRWLGIYPDEWDGNDSLSPGGVSTSQGSQAPKKSGELTFNSHRLFWKPGQYEFRYHHNGKHNVMAISQPIQVVVEKPANVHSYSSVYSTLLPQVARCLDSEPHLVPESAWPLLKEQPDDATKVELRSSRTDEDDFVLLTHDQAERIALILKDSCGIEMTPEVIAAEANIAKLARSVVESAKLLKPLNQADNT